MLGGSITPRVTPRVLDTVVGETDLDCSSTKLFVPVDLLSDQTVPAFLDRIPVGCWAESLLKLSDEELRTGLSQ